MEKNREKAKYPPQPYTQKLIDLGIIEFWGNEPYEDNEINIVYAVNDGYFLTQDNESYEYSCHFGNFTEVYMDDKFECFIVYPYEDMETEPMENPEEDITVYKKMEV